MVYFFALAALGGIGFLLELIRLVTEGGSPGLLFDIATLPGLIPLYGYVRQRRYDPRWLWIVLLVFSGGVTLLALAGTAVELYKLNATGPIAFALVLALQAISLPYFFALYQYTIRSPHIWRSATQR